MKLASAQINVEFASLERNTSSLCNWIEKTDADLIVFPEAALTGYVFASKEAALDASPTSVPKQLIEACNDLKRAAIVGTLLKEEPNLRNAAVLILPEEAPQTYFKTHMPCMGADLFAQPGTDLPVFNTPWGKIGILICFDLRFPEAARTLALKGADLIVVPTNWPVGAEASPAYISFTRAIEDVVFLATCNRPDSEQGIQFIGSSQILSHEGETIAQAGQNEEVLMAEIDLTLARTKRRFNEKTGYATDTFSSRQPGIYTLMEER